VGCIGVTVSEGVGSGELVGEGVGEGTAVGIEEGTAVTVGLGVDEAVGSGSRTTTVGVADGCPPQAASISHRLKKNKARHDFMGSPSNLGHGFTRMNTARNL